MRWKLTTGQFRQRLLSGFRHNVINKTFRFCKKKTDALQKQFLEGDLAGQILTIKENTDLGLLSKAGGFRAKLKAQAL